MVVQGIVFAVVASGSLKREVGGEDEEDENHCAVQIPSPMGSPKGEQSRATPPGQDASKW